MLCYALARIHAHHSSKKNRQFSILSNLVYSPGTAICFATFIFGIANWLVCCCCECVRAIECVKIWLYCYSCGFFSSFFYAHHLSALLFCCTNHTVFLLHFVFLLLFVHCKSRSFMWLLFLCAGFINLSSIFCVCFLFRFGLNNKSALLAFNQLQPLNCFERLKWNQSTHMRAGVRVSMCYWHINRSTRLEEFNFFVCCFFLHIGDMW